MEFKALIEQRRSVRAYRETAITREALEGILTAARRAPSWKNMQASRCYAVVTQEKLAEVRAALPSFNQNSSKNAALIVTTFVATPTARRTTSWGTCGGPMTWGCTTLI